MFLSRAIDFSHEPAKRPEPDTSAPAPDALTSKLWDANFDLANDAINSEYVEGIAGGNLNPDSYCQYSVEDVVYCYHGLQDCLVAFKKATASGDPSLIYFIGARIKRLQHSVDKRKKALYISDPTAVVPSQAAQQYIDLESAVANNLDPVYYVLASVPCLRLWAWMTQLLMPKATPDNIYRNWITHNNDWSGAYQLENFVNSWFAANPGELNNDTCQWVYRGCMLGEVNFFRSACGQPLLQSPNPPS